MSTLKYTALRRLGPFLLQSVENERWRNARNNGREGGGGVGKEEKRGREEGKIWSSKYNLTPYRHGLLY